MPEIMILRLQLPSEVREKLAGPISREHEFGAQGDAAWESRKAGAYLGLSEISISSVRGWHQDLQLHNFSSSWLVAFLCLREFSPVATDEDLRRTIPGIPFFWTEHMVSQVNRWGTAGHGS